MKPRRTPGWRRHPWLVLLLLAGCTTVVVPPAVVEDPVPVFLLDNGRHASLVLPLGERGMVRYAYGDWAYYALVQTGPGRGSSALLWPTQGTLGRRVLPGPPTLAAVRGQVAVPIEQIHPLRLERAAVERLQAQLARLYRDHIDTHVYNPLYDLDFVHHPQDYDALHNSNHAVAGWLEQMGCEVRGPATFSRWRVERPR